MSSKNIILIYNDIVVSTRLVLSYLHTALASAGGALSPALRAPSVAGQSLAKAHSIQQENSYVTTTKPHNSGKYT